MRAWVASPDYDQVVRVLVELRRDAGMSQKALAERLGKPPSFIAKIELKERRVDVVELIAIVRALGADEVEALHRVAAAIPRKDA
jgi:transcriptional regulator with XRE-family HTH domain